MTRAWLSIAALGGALGLAACSSGDGMGTPGTVTSPPETDDGTPPDLDTTAAATSTGVATGAASGDSTTSGPPPADSSSGTTEAGTTDGGCEPGTEACACDSSGECGPELICVGGMVCLPAQCEGDLFEPNDDEASAADLGTINDNDGNGGVLSASLHDVGDVDWFVYQGDDDITGNVDPARDVVSSAGVRLCKFLECNAGLAETEFECPAGTQYALSPSARPGCCAFGPVALPDLNCAGVLEDSALVYIRVDMPEEACVNYSVSYHY